MLNLWLILHGEEAEIGQEPEIGREQVENHDWFPLVFSSPANTFTCPTGVTRTSMLVLHQPQPPGRAHRDGQGPLDTGTGHSFTKRRESHLEKA